MRNGLPTDVTADLTTFPHSEARWSVLTCKARKIHTLISLFNSALPPHIVTVIRIQNTYTEFNFILGVKIYTLDREDRVS
jgi:hypothetical protein